MDSLRDPVVLSGVAAVLVAVITKGIDVYLSRRKGKGSARHDDRELLSKDEKEFRLTIIKQLTNCQDNERRLREENDALWKTRFDLLSEVATLKQRLRSTGAEA